MWRMIFPLILFGAAYYVYYEGHDEDGRFLVFPLVENIPGVGEDLVHRADASALILVGVGLLSAGLQIAWGVRANRRKRAKKDQD